MTKTWLLVADRSRARIFRAEGAALALTEIEDLAHPEGRLHEARMTSDLPGRTSDRFGEGRHAMEEDTAPKRHEALQFAKRIAARLEEARNSGEFARLLLIAEPGFLGMVRDALGDEILRLTVMQIDKNLVQRPAREIRAHLPERL